ncbi:MAG: hypothetical protein ACO1N7_02640 [Sphingobacteriaceae bacterium]
MEPQNKSNRIFNEEDVALSNQKINKEDKAAENLLTGIDHHNYVPRHSTHGRLNSRSFGSDHEPSTMR